MAWFVLIQCIWTTIRHARDAGGGNIPPRAKVRRLDRLGVSAIGTRVEGVGDSWCVHIGTARPDLQQ